jgi:hypothetical protein
MGRGLASRVVSSSVMALATIRGFTPLTGRHRSQLLPLS